MYQNNGMKAYQSSLNASLSDRDADAACFRKLIIELKLVEHETDVAKRNNALSKNQRLWSLIQKANAIDTGHTPTEDRLLFVRMADSAQKYGIRALLHSDYPIAPLIEIAQNVLDGLTSAETE